MPRVESAIAELVIRAGRLTEGTSFLSLDPIDDLGKSNSQRVFISLEAVADSPLAGSVADEVAQRLRSSIGQAGSGAATSVLVTAIEDVNHWLVQANAIRDPERRVCLGFTCVLARGDDVYIAQAAPSQVLIAQEGELYAFPELDSWNWHGQDSAEETASPLGLRETTQPDLYHTKIDAGDVIVLCSTSLARVLQRGPQDTFIRGEVDEILRHVDELARVYGIEDAHAAAVVVPYHHRPRRSRERVPVVKRLRSWCYQLLPEETADRIKQFRKHEEKVDLESQVVHNFDYSADAPASDTIWSDQSWDDHGVLLASSSRPKAQADYFAGRSDSISSDGSMGDYEYWRPETAVPSAPEQELDDAPRKRGRTLTDLLAGVILAFSAAVVGVWQLTVNRDRPIDEPRDDGTLGLPRLNRYDDSMHMPNLTSISRRMPRTPFNRVTALVALLLVAILTTALVISVRNSHQRAHAAKVETAFNTVVTQRQQGEQATNPDVPAHSSSHRSRACVRLSRSG